MTSPLPSPARAVVPHQLEQRSQRAAAIPVAAAHPIKQVGVFALAAIAHIPVPVDLERQ